MTCSSERFYDDLELDQHERATMSMLIRRRWSTPWFRDCHDGATPSTTDFTEAFYADPVRRYMLPVFSDRRTDWPSHPYASRATPFMNTTCGEPKGSRTAIRPRCLQRCCRRARSTAATARAWTWSATRRPQVTKLKLELKPVDRIAAAHGVPACHTVGARCRRLWW